jgi:hypothetical protein
VLELTAECSEKRESMVIDPRFEDPTRMMLGQAIRGDLHELDEMIGTAGDAYGMVIAYCVFATAYIAIDVSGRWPTEADVQEIARHTVESSTDYELSQQDVYDFVFRMALAGEDMNDVFPAPEVDIKLPVLITAQLLLGFRAPTEMALWEYLNSVWTAINKAEYTDLSVLPALMLRSQRLRGAPGK